jgi:prophage antirepressor-like protein
MKQVTSVSSGTARKVEMNSQGSNAIQAFVFPETNQKIRVFVDPDGTLWFVAADVCRLLGYVKAWNAIKQHCKPEGTAKRSILTDGGMQEVTVIDERNLYRLMGQSEAPNADPFQDWLYGEVLPSIRKTGSYGHKPQQQLDLTNLDPDVMLDALINVQQLRKQEKVRLLGWKHTKPNFSTNVPHGDYTACRNYYMTRINEG